MGSKGAGGGGGWIHGETFWGGGSMGHVHSGSAC